MSNYRYETPETKLAERHAPGRQAKITAFRGCVAGLPGLDVSEAEKAEALQVAAKVLLTGKALTVAKAAQDGHADLRSAFKALRQIAAAEKAAVKATAEKAAVEAEKVEASAPQPAM